MVPRIMLFPVLVKKFIFIFVISGFSVTCFGESHEVISNVIIRLDQFSNEYQMMWWLHQSADWNYSTNVTYHTSKTREYVAEVYNDWMKGWKLWARGIDRDILPDSVQETLDIIASGTIIKKKDAKLISDLRSKMTKIYSSANISIPELKINAEGEGEFGALMGKIRDPIILKKIWKTWRIQVGENTRPLFLKFIKIVNKAVQENGYDHGEYSWIRELGSDDFQDIPLSLWKEVKMFYVHLHAYARHKLKLVYGEEHFKDNSYIPAHLLGSLWGENWSALYDILAPYPAILSFNLTENFISNNYTVLNLIEKAEEFYIRAGLRPMESCFWKNSMFVKPKDGRLVDCHAASYDFAMNEDFRIRMCGEIKEQSFFEAVHEIGHIQYYMAYHHLPMVYRNGANSAFHEAVGETMVYAAENPGCLELMNIVKSPKVSSEMILNTLMKQALSKFVLLPWALAVEFWRYSSLAGEIPERMNRRWWSLRKEFQGIEPPDDESEMLFDAGTKYHIINNIPYMRYFIGRFLEHQFLESMCEIAKEDIHSCCFIKDSTAGKRLKKMLALGSSVSWPDALETLTGKRELSAGPLIKYYKPLYLWLVEYNSLHNITGYFPT